ncbi:hypothetical protein [Aneurinibacillus terranovensis]|uniref:hypothetical protein n=1 Tax=Aneurinibacillus terranovensis TaxID=278991 RepID=UPI0004074BA7|nr:hypothetical protein [Aneurinibacillus terranovensis]
MQISGLGPQIYQGYSQLKNQQTNNNPQLQQVQAVSDPDHDNDKDGKGPDIDGKGQKIDFRA